MSGIHVFLFSTSIDDDAASTSSAQFVMIFLVVSSFLEFTLGKGGHQIVTGGCRHCRDENIMSITYMPRAVVVVASLNYPCLCRYVNNIIMSLPKSVTPPPHHSLPSAGVRPHLS